MLLGGGFDMRAHRYGGPDVAFFEVDQKTVLEFKRVVLERGGLVQPPSLLTNYLEADVPGDLAEFGFDPHARTLIIWEGNTMYLPPESIMPFLNRLTDAMSSFRMAFDYFALDLQNRESADPEDRRRLEGVERAMGASFPTGFPDLTVFEKQAPFEVAESGSFSGLAEEYGLGEAVAAYPTRSLLNVYFRASTIKLLVACRFRLMRSSALTRGMRGVEYNTRLTDEGDVPAAVEFGRVAAAPVNTLRQQTHRCQEISVCF